MPVAHYDRVFEMFVQMTGIFAKPIFQRAADAHVIDHRQMLDVLAKSDSTRVRTHRHAEFGSEQQHGQHFVHAA